mgnify:CR=1 FL=1|jgi:hypothetical protein
MDGKSLCLTVSTRQFNLVHIIGMIRLILIAASISSSALADELTMLTGAVTHVRDGDAIEVGK